MSSLGPNNKGASNKKPEAVILYLSSKGAHVNEKDKYGLSPLHYAAMRGNEEATVELLQCRGIDIEVRNSVMCR